MTEGEFRALKFLEAAPKDWEALARKMEDDIPQCSQRETCIRHLEAMAKKAAMLAGYIETRCFGGEHNKAMKQANRNGKIVWKKVFGYNEFHDIRV